MNDFFEDPQAAAALVVRLSKLSLSCKKVAVELDKTESLVHKWGEDDAPQSPNLVQFIKVLKRTRDFDGVRRLAEACGFVCVRRNGSAAEVLRDVAGALEEK